MHTILNCAAYSSYVTARSVGGEPGNPREEQLQAPGQGGMVGGGGGGLGDDDIGNGMEPSETGFTWRSSEGRTFLISTEHVT